MIKLNRMKTILTLNFINCLPLYHKVQDCCITQSYCAISNYLMLCARVNSVNQSLDNAMTNNSDSSTIHWEARCDIELGLTK